MINLISRELREAESVLHSFINDKNHLLQIESAAQLMIKSLGNKNKIISCGNGGSMSDAMHFAEELSGRFRENRKPLAAIAISDPSHISCVGNDYGFEYIFSRYIDSIGKAGDVLFAISTSGNSENILKAVESAKIKKMKVVALSGKNGGKLKDLADISIIVPHLGYSDRIQEMHIKIIHILILLIENDLIE